MLSKTNSIQSRWIALALFPLSSLAIPSVAESSPRVVHVFVALADNQRQGIIPVPPALGNGRDPQHNLYWGAAYGVKTYFKAVRTGDSPGQVGVRETRFWNVAFSRA